MSRQGGGDKKSFACTLVYAFICSCDLSWFKASIFPLKLRAKTVFFIVSCWFLSNNLFITEEEWKRKKIKTEKKDKFRRKR